MNAVCVEWAFWVDDFSEFEVEVLGDEWNKWGHDKDGVEETVENYIERCLGFISSCLSLESVFVQFNVPVAQFVEIFELFREDSAKSVGFILLMDIRNDLLGFGKDPTIENILLEPRVDLIVIEPVILEPERFFVGVFPSSNGLNQESAHIVPWEEGESDNFLESLLLELHLFGMY